ncbi:uncharacterized protein LOC135492651 [Lineus longissimus]|uniref:uncharacterized protein LOC135492651 n=1 Tax=Lineus longissimus TaxID=88925 RepID=UPI002B4E86A9
MRFENPIPILLTIGAAIIGVFTLGCPPMFGDEYGRCLQDIPFGHDLARFLDAVLTEMKKKKFERYCTNYTRVVHCTKSVLQMCPEKISHHEQYFHVADRVMDLICPGPRSARYTDNLMCIVTQRYGLLSQRCDRLFNLAKLGRAHTDPCTLNEDLLLCKHRLIRSGCNTRAAEVAFEINKIVYEKSLLPVPAKCNITLKTMAKSSNAFSYSPRCMPTFPNRLAYCSELFLQQTPRVYKLVPVIVRGDLLKVDKMCRAEREYRACVASVVGNCPKMVQYVEETFQWRLPHEMAQYACSVVYEYKRNLHCYQRMISSASYPPTTKCEVKRNATVHLLQKYYYYKCSSKLGREMEELERHSDSLIQCFYDQAYSVCKSKRAANILKPLLQIKYGTQQFRLNCDGSVDQSKYSRVWSAASPTTNHISKIKDSIFIIVISFLPTLTCCVLRMS